jgi:hypothetical protein
MIVLEKSMDEWDEEGEYLSQRTGKVVFLEELLNHPDYYNGASSHGLFLVTDVRGLNTVSVVSLSSGQMFVLKDLWVPEECWRGSISTFRSAQVEVGEVEVFKWG